MGELHDWIKYWRKGFAKCFKIHKDSHPHRQGYAELSGYLDKVEASAQREELDATVMWAVKFMHRLHELERDIGLHVPDKKVPLARDSGNDNHNHDHERT